MKFRFRNLGPIEDAELELGNLTIIVGRNNTGKTYISYATYGLISAWSGMCRVAAKQGVIRNPFTTDASSTPTSFEITQEALNEFRNEAIPQISSHYASRLLPAIFNTPGNELARATAEIVPSDSPLSDWWHAVGSPYVHIRRGHGNLQVDLTPPDDNVDQEAWQESWFGVMAPHLLSGPLWAEPRVITSERFGISLFYKDLDYARSNLIHRMQTETGDLARIVEQTSRVAQPVKDNVDFVRGLPELVKRPPSPPRVEGGVEGIIGGVYRARNGDIRFSSSDPGSFDIPLHLASSSARALCDLYFFFKHTAFSGRLLIIDEPESHLDTHNQILVARLLARAVNAGIRVMITTHSDYLLKEINNLLMLGRDIPKKAEFMGRHDYAEDEFLKAEVVRAYMATGGELVECRSNEYGLDLPVFDETINQLNSTSWELADLVTQEIEDAQ